MDFRIEDPEGIKASNMKTGVMYKEADSGRVCSTANQGNFIIIVWSTEDHLPHVETANSTTKFTPTNKIQSVTVWPNKEL